MTSEDRAIFSKANILTIGGLSAAVVAALAIISWTLTFSSSQADFREEMRKSIESVKEDGKNNMQAVKDSLRDRSDELSSKISDIKQKLEINDLKLTDRWSGTDMKRLWADFARTWADTKKRNPSIELPDLPDIR